MTDWRFVMEIPATGEPRFDSNVVYEFKRVCETEVERYRLSDQPPHFNVSGLMWRKP